MTTSNAQFSNGIARLEKTELTSRIKKLGQHYEDITVLVTNAVYQCTVNANTTSLGQLMKNWIGARGALIGDGKQVAAYVNALTMNLKVAQDGKVTIERGKDSKAKIVSFKVVGENGKRTAGGPLDGFLESFDTFRKAAAKPAAKKDKPESIAPEAAGEAMPVEITGEETIHTGEGERAAQLTDLIEMVKAATLLLASVDGYTVERLATLNTEIENMQIASRTRAEKELAIQTKRDAATKKAATKKAA